MQKLSSVCKCGHRALNHTPAIGNGCDVCRCEKFVAETDIEKLRAFFYGDHKFEYDFEHDAKLYAAALEHKYAQAVAIAQININAGAECKKELEAALKALGFMEAIRDKMCAERNQAEQERDAAHNEIKRRCMRAKICGCDPCHESICPLHAYRRRGGILDKFATDESDVDYNPMG